MAGKKRYFPERVGNIPGEAGKNSGRKRWTIVVGTVVCGKSKIQSFPLFGGTRMYPHNMVSSVQTVVELLLLLVLYYIFLLPRRGMNGENWTSYHTRRSSNHTNHSLPLLFNPEISKLSQHQPPVGATSPSQLERISIAVNR
jgi:hypothetical protein